jgi:hypothetical protein
MTKVHPKRTAKADVDQFRLSPVSVSLQEEFARFMELHPANRFNRNLRRMLFDYLMHESSLEDFYLKDLLYDLQGLFELFDAIEMEEGLTR